VGARSIIVGKRAVAMKKRARAARDQDVVDEIGRALGVEQEPDAPVITSAEILQARDRHYWHLERQACGEER